ncbi:phosphotransferase [Paenibacillus sp. N3.4]|uniref:phosphotransferase n=1 Tax=Paenibacillus sp. N3.4 TaxID=2603222 RepID=UPI0037C93321
MQELCSDESDANGWFREHGAECLSLAEEAWTAISQTDIQRMLRKEKPSLIHGDVTRPNVIVRSGRVYLVDWETTRLGSAYYEVAKTLNNITNYTVPHIKALLAGYESIRPLDREERLLVASLSRLPRARQIRSGRPASIFRLLKETWGKRLEMVEWLDAWANFEPKHLSTVRPAPK